MINFKSFLLEGVAVLTTSQGSTYEFDAGRSRRNKSVHKYHDPKDFGVKELSDRTVFVHQQLAREIGMWGTLNSKKKRLVLSGGTVYLLSWNDFAGKHGLDRIISDNSFSATPVIGICPLELWTTDSTPWPWFQEGMEVYKSSHPGNQITNIKYN